MFRGRIFLRRHGRFGNGPAFGRPTVFPSRDDSLVHGTPFALAAAPEHPGPGHSRSLRFVPAVGGSRIGCNDCARIPSFHRSLLEQFAGVDGRFVFWALKAIGRWQPTPGPASFLVCQIHGANDLLLPCRLTQPDLVVPGAGHLMCMTHGQIVNEFLRSHMEGGGYTARGTP